MYLFFKFDKAKTYVHNLKLKNTKEWRVYSKTNRPQFIPADPPSVYKNKFKSWSDFLGTGKKPRNKKTQP